MLVSSVQNPVRTSCIIELVVLGHIQFQVCWDLPFSFRLQAQCEEV